MAYSSALFATADEALAPAQKRKLRTIAEKALLRPEDHVLEIGCGWGGFAILAAHEYGCRVTAITISEEQHRARPRAGGRGRPARPGRDPPRGLPRRRREASTRSSRSRCSRPSASRTGPPSSARLEEVLAPGGLAALQAISIPDRRFASYARHGDWIQKHVFPGGLLASLHHATGAMMEAGTPRRAPPRGHRRTLRAHARAVARGLPLEPATAVRALGFDERFVRTWDFYLASCQALFATGRTGVFQAVLSRPGNEALLALPAAGRRAEAA